MTVRSVLTAADQDGGRFPHRCVLTGRATDRAIRLRAVPAWVPEPLADGLGAPVRVGRQVSLPVDESGLAAYRRRQRVPLGLAGAAGGFLGYGLIGGYPNWFGVGLGLVALVLQGRNRRRHWVQVRAGADGDLAVLRAHDAFDRQARQLHTAALQRRR